VFFCLHVLGFSAFLDKWKLSRSNGRLHSDSQEMHIEISHLFTLNKLEPIENHLHCCSGTCLALRTPPHSEGENISSNTTLYHDTRPQSSNFQIFKKFKRIVSVYKMCVYNHYIFYDQIQNKSRETKKKTNPTLISITKRQKHT
jgi:hypothetical protein